MNALKNMMALLLTVCAVAVLAEPQVATLRGKMDLDKEGAAERISPVMNKDVRQARAYPQQPPIVPHMIEGYQLDKNYNKCLGCHSRKTAENAQAVAVSVTHYMNRDGEFLAGVTPARYFCTQCHVVQLDAKPLVENDFIDMDHLIKKEK